MRCTLKSSLFRLFRTKLFIWVIVFALLTGIAAFNNACNNDMMQYSLGRPRYFDTDFLILCIRKIIFIVPFGAAVFCMIFTGSDISSRAINNKIVTGTPRIMIFLADTLTAALATFFSVILSVAEIFILVKFVPVKESVAFNSKLIITTLHAALICIAFTVVFTLLQFFFSNKLFGIVISMFLLPAVMSYPSIVAQVLEQPYRYSYEDEATGETVWELNPEYVGGNARTLLLDSLEINPYYEVLAGEPAGSETAIAAGAVIVLSTAAGFISISRKEFP